MRFLRHRIRRDERGASLILAIAFMLVAGTIVASLLTTTVPSSAFNRVTLDNVRNRQYDADAAIERSISRIRAVNPLTGDYTSACSTTDSWTGQNTALPFRVSCSYSPIVAPNPNPNGDPVSPNNVTFFACQSSTSPCAPGAATITARVNFQTVNAKTVTFVQSWSVNK